LEGLKDRVHSHEVEMAKMGHTLN